MRVRTIIFDFAMSVFGGEWLSGDDPMTGAQASYLKTLCEQAGTSELFDETLTKAEASKRIDEMRQKAKVA